MTSAAPCTSKVAKLESGIEIHYHEAGEGEPVVFLHGAGPGATGLSNFQTNYGYFAGRGYQTLMPDLVGWGQSSKPAGVPYDYALLAGSLKSWLNSIGIEKCTLVGNSLGGALSINLAAEHPEFVQRLVLLAPAAIAAPEVYAKMPGLQAMFTAVSGDWPISQAALRDVFVNMYHDPSDIDDAVVAERAEAAKAQNDDLFKSLKLTSLEDRLGEIACPVLVFWGASDKFCPPETANNILQSCPDSRLVAFAGCGHWVQVEKTELFNRLLLDFLQNG